ncbi:MAG: hypothetical protein AAF696_34360, partial [Bacteroidota bacterium]
MKHIFFPLLIQLISFPLIAQSTLNLESQEVQEKALDPANITTVKGTLVNYDPEKDAKLHI